MTETELFAFALTMFAGLATVIGSALSLFVKQTSNRLLAYSLGFSAGVMIYVSMVELYPKAIEFLTVMYGSFKGNIISVISFFGGISLIGFIDYLIPTAEGDIGNTSKEKSLKLKKMGILTAAAIAIHNFPEGLVTFTSAYKDMSIGIMIAIAIAIHNIPEGISASLPIFFATGDKKKAFYISFFSGLTEPLGAIIGYLVLKPFLNDAIIGILFAVVSGIMMFISLEELLPMAREYEKSRLTVISVILGMLVMAVTLVMMA